ncbi:MAG: hypothetical protein AVDCRST_MAG74-3562 [uncultured Pyrinomonadaceae bacterium]|uniref:Uncharacterized protein n=1 Tax=uncultured Pyrinomonadaceae bacterium TaxID=2283094 RepID=A0A6J4PY08_9BACT|nr:MAG: hypothetical protein AVDCRST_MAG74-3562 [uncultured Pyrinomonadaceae bacterium]
MTPDFLYYLDWLNIAFTPKAKIKSKKVSEEIKIFFAGRRKLAEAAVRNINLGKTFL